MGSLVSLFCILWRGRDWDKAEEMQRSKQCQNQPRFGTMFGQISWGKFFRDKDLHHRSLCRRQEEQEPRATYTNPDMSFIAKNYSLFFQENITTLGFFLIRFTRMPLICTGIQLMNQGIETSYLGILFIHQHHFSRWETFQKVTTQSKASWDTRVSQKRKFNAEKLACQFVFSFRTIGLPTRTCTELYTQIWSVL